MPNTYTDQDLKKFKMAVTAVQQSLMRHSVTLLIWDLDADRPKDLGNATCIELRGVRYLLTAAHVVIDSHGKPLDSSAIAVLFSKDGNTKNTFIQRILAVGGGERDSLDIALLELTAEGGDQIATRREFLAETRLLLGGSADESRFFAVCGAPRAWLHASMVEKTVDAGTMCYVTNSCDPFPSHLNPAHDIALEYNITSNISPSQEGTVEAPEPPGLSGGGIWLITESREGVFWNPSESKLVGVQNRWGKSAGYVRGTQVQFAVFLLNGTGPCAI
ncbi:hypothetical protein MQC82_18475 [Pseudomonas viridiflava]|uniref:hypothetical protein n=1 Tax=Pseudomonas viridiflava TaxID=33069 RepID=UPI001C31BAB3|nr:hypothetical protein [Pseudomonas viridiflava]MCI3911536.1 hypothetical protein [Pseudomonas viridiflava]QXG25587.1 hypothetical protein KTT56_01630 [Pseudomonas viridiflava]